jgi:hypothetical protein
MPYLPPMVAEDRRDFQRLRLSKPILAMMDGQNALILDIGVSGAFIEHYGEPKVGDRFMLLFRWKGTDVEFVSEVAHTTVIRTSGVNVVSHSGMRFVKPVDQAEARLNDMMGTFVGKVLAAQKANAGATEPIDSIALVDLGGARRSRTRGYITYRLNNGTWKRNVSNSPLQPPDGFTVAGYEDEQDLATLCNAYEQADEEGRRLIRMVSELSARTVKKV